MNLAYSTIDQLAELLRIPESERGMRELMIVKPYHGYFDESGTHQGSDIVAVVGYLGTYESWNQWQKEYDLIMNHFAVRDFHMNKFEGRFDEFDWKNCWFWPWAEETRIRLIERFTTICQQQTIIGLGCALVREQYERILTDKIHGDLRHPYYFCMYACLNMLINLGSHWATESRMIERRIDSIKPINFLFDQKKGRFRLGDANIGWEAHAQDVFQQLKRGLDPSSATIGSLTFGDRRIYPQLRAADLICYESAKMARQLWKEPNRPIRKSMEVLRKDYNLLITFPQERQMRNFVRIVETAIDMMSRGASEEEQQNIIRELREKLE